MAVVSAIYDRSEPLSLPPLPPTVFSICPCPRASLTPPPLHYLLMPSCQTVLSWASARTSPSSHNNTSDPTATACGEGRKRGACTKESSSEQAANNSSAVHMHA